VEIFHGVKVKQYRRAVTITTVYACHISCQSIVPLIAYALLPGLSTRYRLHVREIPSDSTESASAHFVCLGEFLDVFVRISENFCTYFYFFIFLCINIVILVCIPCIMHVMLLLMLRA
jgi:hypothetical protein